MELKYSKKFVRQLKLYSQDEKFVHILGKKIRYIQSATDARDITELIRIRKTTAHYRIKIKISEQVVYRIGIKILNNAVWFACIEKDKKRFYKQFP